MIELTTGCLRCKRDYKITEFDSAGYPLHPHYCDECCKCCLECGKFFVVTHFLPILDHPGYQDWAKGITNIHEEPLGLLMGRDLVDDLCTGCKPYREPVAPARVHQSPAPDPEPPASVEEPVQDDGMARLERLLAARKSRA